MEKKTFNGIFEICIKQQYLDTYLKGNKIPFRFGSNPNSDEIKLLVQEDKLKFLLGEDNDKKQLLNG